VSDFLANKSGMSLPIFPKGIGRPSSSEIVGTMSICEMTFKSDASQNEKKNNTKEIK
jgi:hypothetical protein